MEPISELATRITSHLWLLHELYPDQPGIAAILSGNWCSDLERSVAGDWSQLQLLLDLVRDSLEQETSVLGSERKRASFWRPIIYSKPGKPRVRKADEQPARGALASKAVETMAQRM